MALKKRKSADSSQFRGSIAARCLGRPTNSIRIDKFAPFSHEKEGRISEDPLILPLEDSQPGGVSWKSPALGVDPDKASSYGG